MPYPADPGGVFASDVHRRVLGHLPLPDEDPTDVEALVERIAPDEHTPGDEVFDVLADLEADGHASQTEAGWKQTNNGLAALSAPVPEED